MQTYILFILLPVFAASVFAGGSVVVRAETVVNDQYTSVNTTITSRATTGGNSVTGGDGANGANGTKGVNGADGKKGVDGMSSNGQSRSYVEIHSVVDGEVVVDERHETRSEAGEPVAIEVRSDVEEGEASSSHTITVGNRVESGSAGHKQATTLSDPHPANGGVGTDVTISSDISASTSQATTTDESSHSDDIGSAESTPRSPWNFISGLFTKFFTYVSSFFS